MTIIQPSSSKKLIHFLAVFFIILLIGGLFYIYQYNQLVSLKHRLAALEKNYIQAQMLNADLKTQLYQLTDTEILKSIAAEKGLIMDIKPHYLNLEKWLAVSSR